MYTLYTMPSTAGMAPHIVLREIGAAHTLVFVDKAAGGLRTPEYLALNPNGRVPTLVDGDRVVYEAAAIVLHLVDANPQAGLAPPPGTPERAVFYQWLVWLTNTIQPDMLLYFYPERTVPAGAAADALKARAVERMHGLFAQVDRVLAERPYLLGERYTAVDPYLFMLARWTRNMTAKARELPHLGPYLERIRTRPAVREVFTVEGLSAPWY